MNGSGNRSTFALLGALVVIVISVVVLSLVGKADMVGNTILMLAGSVTTLAGALAGFSQHQAPAQPSNTPQPPAAPSPSSPNSPAPEKGQTGVTT